MTMSAIAVEDLSPLGLGASARRRGHLRLVRPGEAPAGTPRESEQQDRAVAVPTRGSASRQLSLTRRGRLAVTLSVATLLVAATIVTLGLFPAGAADGRTVVVEPGQTLSQIAVTHLPELPVDQAIVQIQLANSMNTLQVQTGAELVIPGS